MFGFANIIPYIYLFIKYLSVFFYSLFTIPFHSPKVTKNRET